MISSLWFGIKTLLTKKCVTKKLQDIQESVIQESKNLLIINPDKCICCKTCEQYCPNKCIKIIDSQNYKFNNSRCCECKICQYVCPRGAIRRN